MKKVNLQGIKDNAQHAAGVIVGKIILRPFGLRFSKEQRGQFWFSTVAANLAADNIPQDLFPYKV